MPTTAAGAEMTTGPTLAREGMVTTSGLLELETSWERCFWFARSRPPPCGVWRRASSG